MNSLLERIKSEHLHARKERNTVISNLLGTVIAECDTKAKQEKVAKILSENEILDVVKSFSKKLSETMALLVDKPDRTSDLLRCETELNYLKTFLPQQLTETELTEIAVRQHSLGLNVGQVMGHLKIHYAGRYDAKQAITIVREIAS